MPQLPLPLSAKRPDPLHAEMQAWDENKKAMMLPDSYLPEWSHGPIEAVRRWWDKQNRDHPLNRAVIDLYRQYVPPSKPDWYNPKPSPGGEIAPGYRADNKARSSPRYAGLTDYGAPPRQGPSATMKEFIEDSRSWEMERPVGGNGPMGEPLGPDNEWVIDPSMRGESWGGYYWRRRT